MVWKPPVSVGDVRDAGSIPRQGRFPGGGHGNPLRYSCLKDPVYRAALWATVHGVAEWNMTEATWQACMQYTVAGAEDVSCGNC